MSPVVKEDGLLSDDWHPHFRSGDLVRVETPLGPWVYRVTRPFDPNWVEFSWDWPAVPEAAR
jgi:hypothetical protein